MTTYKTIPDLPAAIVANDSDQLEVSQSGTSRRLTVAQITGLVAGAEGPANVRAFGALGDGITDDTAAIAAAIAAVPAGGALLFPSSSGYLVSQIVIPKSIYFVGVGDTSILRQTPNTNLALIRVTVAAVHFSCRDMFLDQNYSYPAGTIGQFLFDCVSLANSWCEFDNCTFYHFNQGAIRFRGTSGDTTRERLSLQNCRFIGGIDGSDTNDTYCVNLTDCEAVIDKCDFRLDFIPTTGGLPAIMSTRSVDTPISYVDISVTNCRFERMGRFSAVGGLSALQVYSYGKNVLIRGNKFYLCPCTQIRVKTDSDKAIITDNIVDGFQYIAGATNFLTGIQIVLATTTNYLGKYIIANNQVYGAITSGITVAGNSLVNPVYGVIVANNIIDGSLDHGMSVAFATDFQIHGNNIRNSGINGIALSNCTGTGSIRDNVIYTAGGAGIGGSADNSGLSLHISGNTMEATTNSGVGLETLALLNAQNNSIKDVVSGGGGQRAFRVGNTTGVGLFRNNIAIGTFASGIFSNIAPGFTRLYKGNNSWDTVGPRSLLAATGTVSDDDSSLLAFFAGTVTLTLPTPSIHTGRTIRVMTVLAQAVISATANVVQMSGGAATTAIVPATIGKWADLTSNGTNWQITAAN